jgi:segregation and condensation protein B
MPEKSIKINPGQLKSIIESLLFIAPRPLSAKEISKFLNQEQETITIHLKELFEDYKNRPQGGIKIIQNGADWQMVTNPEYSQFIKSFLKQEVNQELTPASLETLSIIAYRGPIKREELEQIRGVNCSIILRNLLIKGLIIEEDQEKQIYNISLDFIKHLGINDLEDLPGYEQLNKEVLLSDFLKEENKTDSSDLVVTD